MSKEERIINDINSHNIFHVFETVDYLKIDFVIIYCSLEKGEYGLFGSNIYRV